MAVFVANANMLTLRGLTSKIEGVLDEATVEVTITDPSGVPYDGSGWPDWPVPMEHVEDSDGDYRAIFDQTLPLVANRRYEALIEAAGGMGTWRFQFTPRVRR
jgi:hypothetical protein